MEILILIIDKSIEYFGWSCQLKYVFFIQSVNISIIDVIIVQFFFQAF